MTELEMYKAMKDIVSTWWNNLTNDQKTAVKLLKFSPAIIGSMFFFDGNTASGFAIGDYLDFRYALVDHGIERNDVSCGVNWKDFHKNEQECRRVEKNIADDGFISKLPTSLKNQVIDNLRRQDDYWNVCWNENIESLKNARKTMFWEAIAELRKSVEG